MTTRPRLYFSFRSPYSWMALHRLQRAAPEVHDALDWIPFFAPDARTEVELDARDIPMHYTDMSKAKHLYILQDTKRLTQRMGLQMRWPIDIDSWWVLPHHAYLAARRDGAGPEFYNALCSARWERGENICTPDVVRAVATQVGLDGDAVAAAPDDDRLRDEGIAGLQHAYDDDVFGMPFLKVGRHKFWGLDRVDDALAQLATAGLMASTTAAPPAVASLDQDSPLAGIPAQVVREVGCLDRDTAGGCG